MTLSHLSVAQASSLFKPLDMSMMPMYITPNALDNDLVAAILIGKS